MTEQQQQQEQHEHEQQQEQYQAAQQAEQQAEWEHPMAYSTPEMSALTQHYREVQGALADARERGQDDGTQEDKDALQERVDAFLAHAAQVDARLDEQSAKRHEEQACWREKLAEAEAIQRVWVAQMKDITRDFPDGFYAALTNLSVTIAEVEMLLGEGKRRREREDAAYVARKREQARREGWRFPY